MVLIISSDTMKKKLLEEGQSFVVGERCVYGTGSYPLPPQGWHLSSLRMVSHDPFMSPCFLSASIA